MYPAAAGDLIRLAYGDPTYAFGFGTPIILFPPLAADDLRVPQRGRFIYRKIQPDKPSPLGKVAAQRADG